jgi:hypothetical protein
MPSINVLRLLPVMLLLSTAVCTRPRAPLQPGSNMRTAGASLASKPAASNPPSEMRAPNRCRPAESAAELRRRLHVEASDAFREGKATPLLVDRWPAPTRVLVFTYRSRGLPTGVVAYEISSPVWKLSVSPLGAKISATRLPSSKVLGKERRGSTDDGLPARLAEAEEALVRAIAGCQPTVTCDQLAPYQTWFDGNRRLARHLAALPGVTIPCVKP